MTELNELSELQSVDFAFGAFLAGAFAGYADAGPKGWREFIKRPVNKQIYRHDADSPAEFMKDFLAAQKDKKAVPGSPTATVNSPAFPVVYYFRKPGLVNTQDQKGSRGRVWNGDKLFKLQQLPVALDYNLVLLAWDKLALDKLQLAWYAYIVSHDAFLAPYLIGEETFDVRVSLMDNKNVAMQNATDTVDGKRLYASTTPVSIMTNILCGRKLALPAATRIIYGGAKGDELQYTAVMAGDLLGFSFDSATRDDGSVPINPGTVKVMVGARIVATDNGKGVITGSYYDVNGTQIQINGTVDYYNGTVSGVFEVPPVGVLSVAFKPLQGRIEVDFESDGDAFYDDGGVIDYDDGEAMTWG